LLLCRLQARQVHERQLEVRGCRDLLPGFGVHAYEHCPQHFVPLHDSVQRFVQRA
jgi:hypothetical protein